MSGGFFDLSSPSFKPAVRLISSISKGSTTTITTSTAHGYVTGMTLRVLVPGDINTATKGTAGPVGMTQMNKLSGKITVIDEYTFTIDIDSTNFDSFTIPVIWPANTGLYPQVVPYAEENDMNTEAVRNVL